MMKKIATRREKSKQQESSPSVTAPGFKQTIVDPDWDFKPRVLWWVSSSKKEFLTRDRYLLSWELFAPGKLTRKKELEDLCYLMPLLLRARHKSTPTITTIILWWAAHCSHQLLLREEAPPPLLPPPPHHHLQTEEMELLVLLLLLLLMLMLLPRFLSCLAMKLRICRPRGCCQSCKELHQVLVQLGSSWNSTLMWMKTFHLRQRQQKQQQQQQQAVLLMPIMLIIGMSIQQTVKREAVGFQGCFLLELALCDPRPPMLLRKVLQW